MTTTFTNWTSVPTLDDKGAEIMRYTRFRAVIPVDEYRRYLGGAEIGVRIEAHDAVGIDLGITDENGTVYLFESRIDGAHVDSPIGDLINGAEQVLAKEGFQPAGFNWVWNGAQFTAGLEALAR